LRGWGLEFRVQVIGLRVQGSGVSQKRFDSSMVLLNIEKSIP
jgi:hypothetical protein